MKIKKALALLLALCLTLAMVPSTAFAESETSGTCGENLTWTFDESTGTLIISGNGEMEDYDIYNINADFAPWRSINQQIVNVVILDGVTSIGDWAFDGCHSLSNITLPDGLTSIGLRAFSGCYSLSNIMLPDGLASIGDSAFCNCFNLSSITLPDGLTSTGNGAFGDCTSLKSIVLPDSLTSIGEGAFAYCNSLSSITLPDGLASIGDYAFCHCVSLSSITLPDGLSSIGDSAFEDCISLKSIVLPDDGITLIGDRAFWHCANLSSITLPDGLTSIGDCAFEGCTSLSSITLPVGLSSIGNYAFFSCTSLSSITLPDGLTSIGDTAFWVCTSLSSIEIPDTVQKIASDAFTGCDSLKDVYYTGSKEEWEQIDIDNSDNGNDPLLNATIHFNSKMPGSKPEEPQPEEPKTCSLDELTDLDYLAFSDLAYKSGKEGMTVRDMFGASWNQAWKKTNFTNQQIFGHIAGWKIYKLCDKDTSTGFFAYAFINDFGETVIAIRGSRNPCDLSPEAQKDWVNTNIPMMTGKNAVQIDDAMLFFNQIALDPKLKTGAISTTGHSLGGGLAEILSAIYGCKSVTFNSAPFLDVAFWYYFDLISRIYVGIDKIDFIDHANIEDTHIGNRTTEYLKAKIVHNSNNSWPNSNDFLYGHSLESLVQSNNGNPELTSVNNVRLPSKCISQDLSAGNLAQYNAVQLGTSSDDIMDPIEGSRKGLKFWALSYHSYGGNGRDAISTDILPDTIVGNRGDDTLDGERGNDTYYYYKGDGFDRIYDVSGQDTLYLIGFDSTDVIEVDSGAFFVSIKLNGEDIIDISKRRSTTKNGNDSNSFTVIVKGTDTKINIEKYITSDNYYNKHLKIACPVNIEVYDTATGEVVYTIQDANVGNFYTDYGNFSVYPEGDSGEFVKVIDLIEGYDLRIVGYDAGTMDIVLYDSDGFNLSDPYYAENVEVTPTMVATIEEVGEQKNLVIDYDGDGVTDSVVPLAAPVVVSFDANGGTGEMAEVSVAADGAYELPECGFIAPEGQTFQGWDVNGTVYAPGEKVTVTEDVTIKALWSAASGEVTPPSGESGGSQTPPTQGPVPTVAPPSTGGASGSTTAPSARPTSPNDTPRTGDFSTPALWVCLMAASGLAVAVLAHTGKKKRK